jgi:hypothetical protein
MRRHHQVAVVVVVIIVVGVVLVVVGCVIGWWPWDKGRNNNTTGLEWRQPVATAVMVLAVDPA